MILKSVLQGDLDVLFNREEFVIFMQSRVPLGPGKFHVVVLVAFSYLTPHSEGLSRAPWSFIRSA